MKGVSLSRSLAGYIQKLGYNDLPSEVAERAKTSVLNVFAGCFAGWKLPWSQVAQKAGENVPGCSTVWAYGNKTSSAEAALANAVMSHSVILEDFTPGLGHPGASIIPAAFAIAEEKNSSGSELITAIVAGYDTLRGVGSGLGNRLYSGSCN